MPMHRIEEIIDDRGCLYHEIQIFTDNMWKPRQMYGKPLRFRLRKQAEMKILDFLK